jgi:eukaryotic-like serine/threonine-protein kinase
LTANDSNKAKVGLSTADFTCSPGASPSNEIAGLLESYLAALEQGVAPEQESWLAAHSEFADELRPYLHSLRTLHDAARDLRAGKHDSDGAKNQSLIPSVRRVGDYRILREIGRGGMGIVYEAHQVSLNRRVALKILPFAAVLDQRQIARFRNEAQAAAQLHHPHIVPVFAVGQEQGVYYYAMQYVDGQSLEQAIDEMRQDAKDLAARSTEAVADINGSSTTRTLRASQTAHRSIQLGDFFRTVAKLGKEAAEALHHAHEYGIVHRDVKPSNLLLDGQGKLWVTDFGLARIQSDSGVTLTGDVVGTLRYMSPEQASGQTGLVDARTDVYSLGVTLYELLTQRHAFPADDRQMMLRQIVSDDPVSLRQHNPAVPVDLETIVLGAMAKSRDERYLSAQALADDLERFLAGKPTLARRPTFVDRTAKWARRHRPLVALGTGAMFLLTLLSALGMALLAGEQARTAAALRQAEHSARTAQENFQRAERHFRQARTAVDQLGARMADRLLDIPGAESARQELLVNTLGYYQQFASEAGDDPSLEQELALAHFKAGQIASKLGATADAIAEYEAARQILAQFGATESSPAPRPQLAVIHNNLGVLFAARGDTDAARARYENAIAIQQLLADRHPDDPVVRTQLAESQANLGMLLEQIGDTAGAERSLRTAVEVLRLVARTTAHDPEHVRNLAISCNNLSFVLRKRDTTAAETLSREAVAILERLMEEPAKARYQDDLALCYNNLAALLSQTERAAEAVEWHRRAIAVQEQLARKSPAVVRHRSDLAITLNNVGMAYCRANRAADADTAFARARELFATLSADYPDELAYRSSLAALLNNQAVALADAGRHDDAIEIYPTAIESQRACSQQLSTSSLMRALLGKMYYNYGQSLRQTGNLGEAVQASLARRDLWDGDGDRLFGVAVELAEIGSEMRAASQVATAKLSPQRLEEEVVTTLWDAYESGWPSGADLGTDVRFAHLQGNERFRVLVAQLNSQSAEPDLQRLSRSRRSPSATN